MTYDNSDGAHSSKRHSSKREGRGRERANAFRAGARHAGRKERVLHTRISEQLSEDIRRFAEDLRVPASNLVRNVLEEVFVVVDGVSEDVGELLDDLFTEAEGVRDRVRDQTRAQWRRRASSRSSGVRDDSGNAGDAGDAGDAGRAGDVDEADVEAELRRDEAFEDTSRNPSKRDATAGAAENTDAGSSTFESEAPNAHATSPKVLFPDVLFPDVLGWQPLVLNRDLDCGRCQRSLRAGESAFLGLASSGLTEIALCGRCAGRR